MRILITEDDPKKIEEISNFAVTLGFANADILIANSMAEFTAKFDSSISICVIDLLIPAYEGAQVQPNGLGILQYIDQKGLGRVQLLGISSYPEEFEAVRDKFESRGCMIVSFQSKEVWQGALKVMSVHARGVERRDFLIFCALGSERMPYTGMVGISGRPIYRGDEVRFDVSINGRPGSVIQLPRVGLVDAASTVASHIEKYVPNLVCMSGICAGFKGRSNLGELLISELAYEYQSGKWTSDGFSQEPYQVPVSERVRNLIRSMLDDSNLVSRIEAGCTSKRPSTVSAPKLSTFTSGSAVIASSALIDQVSSHHRRVSGLDMEVYGLHRAAYLSTYKPDVICAKTVVDLADDVKDDELHPYGSYISAKFIVEAVSLYYSRERRWTE